MELDKSSKQPVYKQIIEKLTNQILSGELLPGTRLLTEREFSLSTGISRGTVKRAYDELSHIGIIDRTQGRGTYVSNVKNQSAISQHHKAKEIVNRMLDDLTNMQLSHKEIESLISSKIKSRQKDTDTLRIAVVDCNMETLNLISGQLHLIENVHITEIILSNLEKLPQKLTYGYDLILTTGTHYLRVIELAPTVADRIIRVAITMSPNTRFLLLRIPDDSEVGIWCMSQEFANIVYGVLLEQKKEHLNVSYHLDYTTEALKSFLEGKNVLILPADYQKTDNAADKLLLEDFQKSGGLIIPFEYLIDKGSLIHINHEINKMYLEKTKV